MDRDLPILAYHKVDSQRELGITSLSPERFERQIKFLRHQGYTSISPPEILDSRFLISDSQNCRSETKNRKYLITFDDGYEGLYTHAYPILKKYESTAIIFVVTGYIGKYNSWDASPGPRFRHLNWVYIREMANHGIWFGSHTVNHTFLTRQGDSAARYEIEASKKDLEDGLGQPIRFFSYPYGAYNDRIISFVRQAGYEAAFSLRPEFLKPAYMENRDIFNPRSSVLQGDEDARERVSSIQYRDIYALPRIAIYLVDNMWAFKAKTGCVRSGSLKRKLYMQKVKNQLINRCAYAGMLVERLRS